MASRAKKTTFAKLNREAAVRERRVQKQMRKDARKQAAAVEARADAPPTGDEPVRDVPPAA